jgi:hypothetical protein
VICLKTRRAIDLSSKSYYTRTFTCSRVYCLILFDPKSTEVSQNLPTLFIFLLCHRFWQTSLLIAFFCVVERFLQRKSYFSSREKPPFFPSSTDQQDTSQTSRRDTSWSPVTQITPRTSGTVLCREKFHLDSLEIVQVRRDPVLVAFLAPLAWKAIRVVITTLAEPTFSGYRA